MTSLIGGGCGWLWERGKRSRTLRRKAAFFGVVPGEPCLVVVGNKHGLPDVTHRKDVDVIAEIAALAGQFGSDVVTESSNTFRGSNDDRTEFCVGGPLGEANVRTGGHLAAHLPGVRVLPYREGHPDSVALVVGEHRYPFDKNVQEYALVAKFTPPEASRPVLLLCGQSPLANRAAVHHLRRRYAEVARALESVDRFCIVIKVPEIRTYGYQAATLERDVTREAFARG
ncbi:hypothetical protein [Streptomyces sp. NPDC056600]|uniref:hypothetical protein n=1 Tax=Streptomyces sp. NPDC056600 TaxID=3345874 RepID=UPI00369E6DC7